MAPRGWRAERGAGGSGQLPRARISIVGVLREAVRACSDARLTIGPPPVEARGSVCAAWISASRSGWRVREGAVDAGGARDRGHADLAARGARRGDRVEHPAGVVVRSRRGGPRSWSWSCRLLRSDVGKKGLADAGQSESDDPVAGRADDADGLLDLRGTWVVSVPTESGERFAYGTPGSLARRPHTVISPAELAIVEYALSPVVDPESPPSAGCSTGSALRPSLVRQRTVSASRPLDRRAPVGLRAPFLVRLKPSRMWSRSGDATLAGIGPDLHAAEVPAGAVLADLRSAQEWAAGHAPGSINFPLDRLRVLVGSFSELERIWGTALPDARPLYLICGNGVASGWLAYHMISAGRDARVVEGRMPASLAAGLPVERS